MHGFGFMVSAMSPLRYIKISETIQLMSGVEDFYAKSYRVEDRFEFISKKTNHFPSFRKKILDEVKQRNKGGGLFEKYINDDELAHSVPKKSI